MSTATAQQRSTETLFQQWRKGDAQAGQAMAQRFTDWYFAIAATRLGETDGDTPFREACTMFSRGVGKVGDARRLLGWAHGIARKQIHAAAPGGRVGDGDLPNAFTLKHPPKDVLVRVRQHLPSEMALLEHAYQGKAVDDPQQLLRARYRVKAFLRQQLDVPFRVTPDHPDPDRAPIPFYESGQMNDEAEDTHFELFMLNDMETCQDIAEFAHFAIALRGGLPGPAPTPRPEPAPTLPEPTPQPPADSPVAHVDAPSSGVERPQARVIPPEASPRASGGDGGGDNMIVYAIGGVVTAIILAMVVVAAMLLFAS